MPRDKAYVKDILHAIRQCYSFSAGMTWQDYQQDAKTQAAIERKIEIVGEAARRLSDEFKAAHPEIPWRDVIGMRNFLIHEYEDVDQRLIWDAVQRDFPDLEKKLSECLSTM